jgi:predicted DNA-binding transcriptional regulator YafY
MNRTDRLLAIVLELQGRGRRRSEDLAATFEVSKRTIYRDIEALCQMGVPVVSVPGRGYSLVEGYFLPPLRFTADEAIILTLGSDVMAQSFDAEYRLAAESGSRKIVGALPEELRDEVQSLQESIRFMVRDSPAGSPVDSFLQQIRRAIIGHYVIGFEYHTRHGRADSGTWSYREVDPYGLVNLGGAWYVPGYCHMQKGTRIFRVQRMENLRVLDRHFTRPAGFKIGKRTGGDDRNTIVRALFSPDIVSWVRESPSFFSIAQEDTPDGLLVTFSVREEKDILQYILGWGRHVRVLEPQSFVQRIAEEAEVILQHHKNPESLLT